MMDTKLDHLIKMFNLEDEIGDYVVARVKELAEGRNDFSFSGTNHTGLCGINGPHIPHITGSYDTVRYGLLDYFCLGKEGKTTDGELIINVEHYGEGSPEYPATARGYWLIKR